MAKVKPTGEWEVWRAQHGEREAVVIHHLGEGITGYHDVHFVNLYVDGAHTDYWIKNSREAAIRKAEHVLASGDESVATPGSPWIFWVLAALILIAAALWLWLHG